MRVTWYQIPRLLVPLNKSFPTFLTYTKEKIFFETPNFDGEMGEVFCQAALSVDIWNHVFSAWKSFFAEIWLDLRNKLIQLGMKKVWFNVSDVWN